MRAAFPPGKISSHESGDLKDETDNQNCDQYL